MKNTGRRLLQPLVKKPDGSWAKEEWGNVLGLTIERLNAVRDEYGGDAVLGLVSGLSSNEELVCFRDLMVKGWAAGIISTVEDSGFREIYRTWMEKGKTFKEVSWKKVTEADFILAVGAVPQDSQPVVGSLIRKCIIRNKMRSASIGSSDFLYPYGSHHIAVKKEDELLLVRAVLSEVVSIMKKTAPASDVPTILEQPEPVKIQDIIRKLQLDDRAAIALDRIIRDYVDSTNPLIVVGENIASRRDPSGLNALVNLALLKGLYSGDRLRLVVLKPSGNSIGAYKLLRMFDNEKKVKIQPKAGLFLLAEDRLQNSSHIKNLEGFDFLAVISTYWPPSLADSAHVLIPKPLWMEMDGTYTGLDGCEIAYRQKMLDAPSKISASWQTLMALAEKANVQLGYTTWEELRQKAQQEIQRESPR